MTEFGPCNSSPKACSTGKAKWLGPTPDERILAGLLADSVPIFAVARCMIERLMKRTDDDVQAGTAMPASATARGRKVALVPRLVFAARVCLLG